MKGCCASCVVAFLSLGVEKVSSKPKKMLENIGAI